MNDTQLKRHIISILDFTSLNASDTEASIRQFCTHVEGSLGRVAAVCVYPQFMPLLKDVLANSDILLATVANFPSADEPLSKTLKIIDRALKEGADEIDVVMPFKAYLAGEHQLVFDYILKCKERCQDKTLKVILETGELGHADTIYQASLLALEAGADFIKTSTGKVNVGATPEAAKAMLKALKEYHGASGNLKGLKLSGGIKTVNQVCDYFRLCEKIFSTDYIQSNTFRIGASSLLAVLYE